MRFFSSLYSCHLTYNASVPISFAFFLFAELFKDFRFLMSLLVPDGGLESYEVSLRQHDEEHSNGDGLLHVASEFSDRRSCVASDFFRLPSLV